MTVDAQATGPEREADEITVVLADGHPFYLRGLSEAIIATPGMSLVGAASESPDLVELVTAHRPAIAVVDVELPGLDVPHFIQAARRAGLPTQVLLLAERQFGEQVLESLSAGAAGFLNKTIPEGRFIDAVRRAADGRSVVPGDIGSLLADTLRQHGENDGLPLSARESEILQLIANGASASEMALRLQLAVPTVKSHIHNLYGKLGAHDRGSAVAKAIRRGIVQ